MLSGHTYLLQLQCMEVPLNMLREKALTLAGQGLFCGYTRAKPLSKRLCIVKFSVSVISLYSAEALSNEVRSFSNPKSSPP